MTTSKTIEAPTILLVDDNPTNLQVLYAALDGRGYTLLVARSGEQAIKTALKTQPALILLDVMMPGLDGYETCTQLNGNEATRECAVIFLSALHDSKDKVHGLELGAVDFITKPFDTDEVIARVERQLEVQGKQHALAEQNRRLAGQLEATQRFAFDASQDRAAWVGSLIEGGESERVEFKSTLRWNLKTDQADKALETAWLKTIVAFLNTDGGVLIIGADDAGHILGTEADRFENDDKYLLFVNSRIKQHIGLDRAPFIRFGLTPVDDKWVLVIECRPSPTSVFLRYGDKEEFYVRVGPGSRKLTVSEVLNYVANRNT
jgi:DNA-binding response OmpR family regulator